MPWGKVTIPINQEPLAKTTFYIHEIEGSHTSGRASLDDRYVGRGEDVLAHERHVQWAVEGEGRQETSEGEEDVGWVAQGQVGAADAASDGRELRVGSEAGDVQVREGADCEVAWASISGGQGLAWEAGR